MEHQAQKHSEPDDGDFTIDYEGNWWHRGGRINRDALVKLFSDRALKLIDGEYWLKTPTEAYRVHVEDVPYVFVNYRIDNPGKPDQVIHLTTNMDETITLGADCPLIVDGGPGQGVILFYAEVRDGLRGRCNRAVNYDLIAHAMEEDGSALIIRSGGAKFTVMPDDF